ncbi:hypothetical protein LTR97_010349 [Elasticomyces elasticus]|uniref:Uncharacterized protein n=1 Tax=Elasticomyces elasticus TaxID=574655 RepID=A0AAN7W3G3_9PEZI|nr:hypothetical protein LTR97_010349 [Elasticomyces elasticus]
MAARVMYQCPRWVLKRAIVVSAYWSMLGGPRIALTTKRILPYGALIFHYAETGQVESIQQLFASGKASPIDTRESDGWNLLHIAINAQRTPLIRFLIEQGCDWNLEDALGTSAACLAWDKIFGKALRSEEDTDVWKTLFYDDEHLEARSFPIFTKIVVGLNGACLEQQLAQSTIHLNDKDAGGFTALAWAAYRGDLASVQTLLAFEADPNIRVPRRLAPLEWAAEGSFASAPAIIQELLKHGATVDATNARHQTAIMAAARGPDPRAAVSIEILAQYGASVNHVDKFGNTAISLAAWYGHSMALQTLLGLGADATIADTDNKTPIMGVVQNNHHAVLQLLIENKVTCRTRDNNGWTIFHWAARYADKEMMCLLATGTLDGLYTPFQCPDAGGVDANDVFAGRILLESVDDALTDMFAHLLHCANYDESQKAEAF